jgi:hypothetical protein
MFKLNPFRFEVLGARGTTVRGWRVDIPCVVEERSKKRGGERGEQQKEAFLKLYQDHK